MVDFLSIEIFSGLTVLRLIWMLLVVFLILFLSKMIILSLRMSLKDRLPEHTMKLMEKVVFYSFALMAIFSLLSFTGLDLGSFLLAGSIVGIIVGFAAQSSMANLVAGFLLLLEAPFRIGDAITWGEQDGIVVNMSLMSTRVRTYSGLMVRIPNEKLFTSALTNNFGIAARRFEYDIEIRYRDDARKAIEVIKRCADEHPLILKRPDPAVFVKDLGDHGILLKARFWGPIVNWTWWRIYQEFLLTLREELLKEGIDIPFPQMTLWTDEPLKTKSL
ncbi:MAG: mechanosensitive ion channel family protein [Candidatus Thermoplasmatota archaeon]|nr:mechanosensitive ion channel family protein [Candidatus Thermoplasmatota archaeon]